MRSWASARICASFIETCLATMAAISKFQYRHSRSALYVRCRTYNTWARAPEFATIDQYPATIPVQAADHSWRKCSNRRSFGPEQRNPQVPWDVVGGGPTDYIGDRAR